jgi:hypothetical protein
LNYLGLHVQALIVTSRGGVKISSKEEIRISIELNKPDGLWTKYFETGSIPSDDFLEIRGQQIQGERESFD